MASTLKQERQGRDVTINLRANRRQRALIDRAAEALGKNRSDFMRAAKLAPCWLTADSSFSTRRSIGALRRPSTSRRPRTPACAACWRLERRGSGEGRGRSDRRAGAPDPDA